MKMKECWYSCLLIAGKDGKLGVTMSIGDVRDKPPSMYSWQISDELKEQILKEIKGRLGKKDLVNETTNDSMLKLIIESFESIKQELGDKK